MTVAWPRLARHMLRTGVVWALGALVLASVGCSGSRDGVFDLQLPDLEYTFEVPPGTLRAGVLVPVLSADSLDLSALLRARGFRPGDVVSARVERPQLFLEQPARVGVGILDEVVLRLRASEGSADQEGAAVEVARSERFTGLAGRALLEPLPGNARAAIGEGTRGELALQANASEPGVAYRFRVRFDLNLEVRAF